MTSAKWFGYLFSDSCTAADNTVAELLRSLWALLRFMYPPTEIVTSCQDTSTWIPRFIHGWQTISRGKYHDERNAGTSAWLWLHPLIYKTHTSLTFCISAHHNLFSFLQTLNITSSVVGFLTHTHKCWARPHRKLVQGAAAAPLICRSSYKEKVSAAGFCLSTWNVSLIMINNDDGLISPDPYLKGKKERERVRASEIANEFFMSLTCSADIHTEAAVKCWLMLMMMMDGYLYMIFSRIFAGDHMFVRKKLQGYKMRRCCNMASLCYVWNSFLHSSSTTLTYKGSRLGWGLGRVTLGGWHLKTSTHTLTLIPMGHLKPQTT